MKVGDLLVSNGYVELCFDGIWRSSEFFEEYMFFIYLGEAFISGVSLVWVLTSRGSMKRVYKTDLKAA